MINYELAKQLKEAGFPQKSEKEWWKYWKFPKVSKPKRNPRDDKEWKCVGYEIYSKPKQDNSGYWELIASCPALSELIDACGDKFDELTFMEIPKTKDRLWVACGYGKRIECPKCHSWEIEQANGDGKSPEEAVAKLWLKLRDRKE